MTTDSILKEMLVEGIAFDRNGDKHQVHSNLDRKESDFLRSLVRKHQPKQTIEVGCAFGISSLSICEELKSIEGARHTSLDPFQRTQWHDIGRYNLEKAGFDFFDIIEEKSEIALPRLLSEGKKYDFGFIDGWHTFDHTLIDFFYLNRMLNVGGIIVVDDVHYPGISKMMRYVMNYPCYELLGCVETPMTRNQIIFEFIIQKPLRVISSLFPELIKREIFSAKVIKSNKDIGVQASMVALRKTREDERSWNWFAEF